MAYSLDLRQRVVAYIEAGGKITEASKIYKIGKASIYRWLNRVDLSPI
ncbi:helix-turn-helix domain-containing protein, partial [Synechocystis sp. FACHB-908]